MANHNLQGSEELSERASKFFIATLAREIIIRDGVTKIASAEAVYLLVTAKVVKTIEQLGCMVPNSISVPDQRGNTTKAQTEDAKNSGD